MSRALDEFREISREPVEATWRYVVQVSTGRIWVGAYELASGSSSSRCLFSRGYERPPGKTTLECQEAGLTVLTRAAADGLLHVG